MSSSCNLKIAHLFDEGFAVKSMSDSAENIDVRYFLWLFEVSHIRHTFIGDMYFNYC